MFTIRYCQYYNNWKQIKNKNIKNIYLNLSFKTISINVLKYYFIYKYLKLTILFLQHSSFSSQLFLLLRIMGWYYFLQYQVKPELLCRVT